ncbi:steroidogenic factor 1-like [Podarcis muralis]
MDETQCSSQYAVHANHMRGGWNRFRPMYKQDRAMKQQKKALIHTNSFKLETAAQPPIVSPVQAAEESGGLSASLHGLSQHHQPEVAKGLPPPSSSSSSSGSGGSGSGISSSTAMTPIDYECNSYGTPAGHGPLSGHHYPPFASWAIKSEFTDPYVMHPNEAAPPYPYPEVYPSGGSPATGADMPDMILKLLEQEPDEAQVKACILSCLQEEQSKGLHNKLSAFGLMCKMADQTLFAIVEWARSCIFFKELEVDMSTVAMQAGSILNNLVLRVQELVLHFHSLQVDRQEFVCLKFLILFSLDKKFLKAYRLTAQVKAWNGVFTSLR